MSSVGGASDRGEDAIASNRSHDENDEKSGGSSLSFMKRRSRMNGSSTGHSSSGEDSSSEAQYARSTISSPGKLTYRDRLRQRLSLQTKLKMGLKKSRTRSSSFNMKGQNKDKDTKKNKNNATSDADGTTEGTDADKKNKKKKNKNTNKKVDVVYGDDLCRINLDKDDEDSDDDIRANHSRQRLRGRKTDTNDTSVVRLSRQVRYGLRGEFPPSSPTTNAIKLHIYDLVRSDSVMDVMGLDFPIGKCFGSCNNGLHALGTGVYHCGVEVNGIEYAYGMNDIEGASGVFTCIPKHSPGYQFRQTLCFGNRRIAKKMWITVEKEHVSEEKKEGEAKPKKEEVFRQIESFIDGRTIMQAMASEYKGLDYDLLRKNCCTFAKDACLRLGVKEEEIPNWFMNLAGAGAQTQDSLKPLQDILSFGNEEQKAQLEPTGLNPISPTQPGFEVIAQTKEEKISQTEMEIVRIVEAVTDKKSGAIGFRRTLSWTY